MLIAQLFPVPVRWLLWQLWKRVAIWIWSISNNSPVQLQKLQKRQQISHRLSGTFSKTAHHNRQIAVWSWFNSYPCRGSTLRRFTNNNYYSCLVVSNKQKINWKKIKGSLSDCRFLLESVDFSYKKIKDKNKNKIMAHNRQFWIMLSLLFQMLSFQTFQTRII